MSYVDPTPDVPEGVVNWPRQKESLRVWAQVNGIYSDHRGYLSGAIQAALEQLDLIMDAAKKWDAAVYGTKYADNYLQQKLAAERDLHNVLTALEKK